MVSYVTYDIAIIGGGISSCVFTSSHIKNGFNGRIAIIEYGRDLGGRSSTRNSLANKGWQLNHGSPNFNICNYTNNSLLKNFINQLLDKGFIQTDSSELNKMYANNDLKTKINSDFYSGENYISKNSMSELSRQIISLNKFKNQIDYFFKTLIVKLEFKKNRWIITSNNGEKFISKILICSSNLLLHKRSLNILDVNQIPLRKAIPFKSDVKIDRIINLLNQQNYIPRLTFLIYTKHNYCYKDDYMKKYRYFFLDDFLEENFKFERIIFQKQKNNNLGIVIHTKNDHLINEYFQSNDKEVFKKNILFKFNKLFDNHICINNIINYEDISIMIWKASQPSGIGIPENLQLCENYNIGFCGDWFALEGFGRIEGAILSGLKLSNKINLLI